MYNEFTWLRKQNHSPEQGQAFILIGEGEYHETVNITRSGPLTLLVR